MTQKTILVEASSFFFFSQATNFKAKFIMFSKEYVLLLLTIILAML